MFTAMLNANQLFGEAVKQVYEPDWSGREKFVHLLDVSSCFKWFVDTFTKSAILKNYYIFCTWKINARCNPTPAKCLCFNFLYTCQTCLHKPLLIVIVDTRPELDKLGATTSRRGLRATDVISNTISWNKGKLPVGYTLVILQHVYDFKVSAIKVSYDVS